MFPFTFAGLLTTPAPSAVYLGIASIALFAIMAVLVGPDYDQQKIHAKKDSSVRLVCQKAGI